MPQISFALTGRSRGGFSLGAALWLTTAIVAAAGSDGRASTGSSRWVPLRARVIEVSTTATVAAPVDAKPAAKLQFAQDIQPILAENCFPCHGPAKGKGGLHLDDRKSAVESGAIVPGNPDQSTVISRIYASDADELMPPPLSHKTLTGAQKEALKRWIAEGADYGSWLNMAELQLSILSRQ